MDYDIEFAGVSFRYAGAEQYALSGINLKIRPGEIVLVTGPAGSGKTTLCSCINGLVPHYHEGDLSGQVIVRSYNTQRARIGGLASLVGMVFQDPESQLVTSSVADEVAFGPENLGVPRAEIHQRVVEALSATRLLGYEDREPHNLSGGEQQACAIAATYSMHPEIYVMDEPLANLDPAGRQQVLRVLIEVAKKRQKTLVIVEHALEEVLPMVDRVLVMDGGRIARDGKVEEVLAAGDIPGVFTRPAIARLADSFGLGPMIFSAGTFYEELNARQPFGFIEFSDDRAAPPPTASTPIIEIQNVRYSYPGHAAALRDVSLTIHAGELVVILGRNGSGKTTLARHIIGLLQPEQGRVIVDGRDVAVTPTHKLTQEIGFCFQNPNHQLVAFNVRDEMLFGLKAHNIDPAEFDQRIRHALELVHMHDFIDAEIFDLGKGQKQRLALASVLTLNPKILIIDEPTTGQDPQMTREIFEIIKHLNDLGTTVLMITHRVDYAAAFADRAVVMNRGVVAFDGPILDLISDLEMMQANSLDLPDITGLALRLRKHGVPSSIIQYEELERYIRQLVEAHHGD